MRRRAAMPLAVAGLLLALPLLARATPEAFALTAGPLTIGLLLVTLRQRARATDVPRLPGVGALAAFLGLGLVTTAPLPPAVVAVLSPRTAQLYTAMLPGWPGGGGWTVWRPLALDPYAAWLALAGCVIGFGVYAIVAGYPWHTDESAPRASALATLLPLLLAGGVLLASVGLVQRLQNRPRLLGLIAPPVDGRASGPFAGADQLAAWLGMLLPVTLAYVLAVGRRVSGRLVQCVAAGRRVEGYFRAVRGALLAHQRRLLVPLVAGVAALLVVFGHMATASPGGTTALLLALAGIAAGGAVARRSLLERRRRRVLAAAAIVLAIGSGASLALWALDDASDPPAASTSLSNRLVRARAGVDVLATYPLFGAGLGTWRHLIPGASPAGHLADKRANDYVEVAVECGAVGAGLLLLFFLIATKQAYTSEPSSDPPGERAPVENSPAPDWRIAASDVPLLRAGLLAGVGVALLQGGVDSPLRTPANLALLLALLALAVTTRARVATARRGIAPIVLVALSAAALVPSLFNAGSILLGGRSLSAHDCLTQADAMLAAPRVGDHAQALALVRRALDRSPLERAAHEDLAAVLGPGDEGDRALRRALVLDPAATRVRDQLAWQLWARGEHVTAAVELETSILNRPELAAHRFLEPDGSLPSSRAHPQLIDGDALRARLAGLDAGMANAIARGLERARTKQLADAAHATVVSDLALLHEARGEWSEAADLLVAEGARGGAQFGRAGRDYLAAGDRERAERALLAGLRHTPEDGQLYRTLALDVYAARGDLAAAEKILQVGERNAVDMVPVYQGVTELLGRHEEPRAAASGQPLLAGAARAEVTP